MGAADRTGCERPARVSLDQRSGMTPAALLDVGTRLLYREAACLDERLWDEWLALFAPDCEYWVPTWCSEEELASDPQRQLSHVYYASRSGLEDRIVRLRSGRSPASLPLRRTAHLVSNVELVAGGEQGMRLRSTWANHIFDPHHCRATVLFGFSRHELVFGAGGWLIRRKKIVLQNDYLPSMIDVYCL